MGNWIIPWLVLTTGQGMDAVTTHQALARGCVEGNSAVYGSVPSAARLVVSKAVAVGGVSLGVVALRRLHHPVAARRLALAVGGVGAAEGTWNLFACQ